MAATARPPKAARGRSVGMLEFLAAPADRITTQARDLDQPLDAAATPL